MTDALSIPSVGADPMVMADGLSSPQGMALRLKGPHSEAQIDKISKDFEAMFATEMLQPMFKGVEVDSIFGGGHGEETMRLFLLREYGRVVADTGKLGVADKVKAQMLRAQESEQQRATAPAAMASAYQTNRPVQGVAYGSN